MSKLMKLIAAVSLAAMVISAAVYRALSLEIFLSLAITFGTIAYHFIMRLLVGLAFRTAMHNRADLHRKWCHVSGRELSFYEKLHVKKWKKKMPTYDSTLFDPRIHTWSEIAQAMCQAELVHETIVLLSFLPILAGIPFGSFPVFIITSVLSAAFDMLFVIMQRYNRGRIMHLMDRKK